MSTYTILVVGATGQQGGYVLSELSHQLSSTSKTTPKIKILALTRSASSPKAQALPSKYPALDLTVVEGDTRDPGPIFGAHPHIDAVFSYTTPPDEEPQATALIDFTAAATHGEPKSWDTPTDIPHFTEKHNVELHLRKAVEESRGRVTYTVLRPVAFMDNCEFLCGGVVRVFACLTAVNPGGTFGKVFASLWNTLSANRKLQVVSVRDIGLFGRRKCTAVSRVGPSCRAWTIVGWAVRGLVARNVGAMFRWFETDGYGVDIAALRKEEPRLQNFEMWLRESSKFEFDEREK
ncbi:NAD(P)-binding protein [Hypoxylon trugodes]|uniref:NAD(P)-binding protein n=1 Tax=Hypoxylon trugodes TaxID=326681 RepID=UPI00219AF58D|nr:NAD(P)-binding protein [Hypoxylon trugodes]KAI1388982.1 NAD(P)-binding protein [Hypoxylon trugodes]